MNTGTKLAQIGLIAIAAAILGTVFFQLRQPTDAAAAHVASALLQENLGGTATLDLSHEIALNDPLIQTLLADGDITVNATALGPMAVLTPKGTEAAKGWSLRTTDNTGGPSFSIPIAIPTLTRIVSMQPVKYDPNSAIGFAYQWHYTPSAVALASMRYHHPITITVLNAGSDPRDAVADASLYTQQFNASANMQHDWLLGWNLAIPATLKTASTRPQ